MAQHQAPEEVMRRYLQDAIAAEETFEKQLRDFAGDQPDGGIKRLFSEHADETKRQRDQLEQRLRALGGGPSGFKSFMGGIFGMGPKAMQLGHAASEKVTQDLMMVFAIEHSEIAMYEALIAAAELAGDRETAGLCRRIQDEERRAAQKVWDQIRPQAEFGFRDVTGQQPARRAA